MTKCDDCKHYSLVVDRCYHYGKILLHLIHFDKVDISKCEAFEAKEELNK